MNNSSTHLRAFLMLGLVMLCWAGNSIIGRAVRFDIPPGSLAFGRWLLALIVLLPFAWKPLWRERHEIAKHWKWIVILGLLGIAAFNTLLYAGLRYTTATNALLLQSAVPALVILFDRLFFGARAQRLQVLGVIFSIFGVVIIVFEGDPAAALRLHLGAGDLWVLASVLVWSLYTVLLRMKPAIAPICFVVSTFAVGVITLFPVAAWEWSHGEVVHWKWSTVGAYAYVALLSSVLAYFIYNWAAGVIGGARAGQATTLLPVFGAILSALLLGEVLQPYHFGGIASILTGIILGIISSRRAMRAKVPLAQVK
ncbi:DMT family transporter [Altericroceibacterium endophyticum]|uniref:EamA family transporter n=1 Tax=Altericroceibacterium endophyticum TaxID=1808508 RepID=A0A6I4T4X0_9SPHN|nr:DMT family transporter [Altericroceibacterium endophyticum]MXO65093.1 EamA family transporter [Altericroceibacterium endophyticum]